MTGIAMWLVGLAVYFLTSTTHMQPLTEASSECAQQQKAVQHPAVTAELHLVGAETGLATQFRVHEHGVVKWTALDEQLLVLGGSLCGPMLLLIDPATNSTKELAKPYPFWQYEVQRNSNTVSVVNGKSTERIRLPGPVADQEPWPSGVYPQFSTSPLAVYVHQRRVTVNRGQLWSALPSPSGRWFAVIGRQPTGTNVLYRIEPTGSHLEWVRQIGDGERNTHRLSPRSEDGEWGIADDMRRVVRIEEASSERAGVWFGGDNRVAVLDDQGIWMLDPNEDAILLVAGCCSIGLVEWTESGIYYTVGRHGEGDN